MTALRRAILPSILLIIGISLITTKWKNSEKSEERGAFPERRNISGAERSSQEAKGAADRKQKQYPSSSQSVRDFDQSQMDYPFSAIGVNRTAAAHYGINEEERKTLREVGQRYQVRIATEIANNLMATENAGTGESNTKQWSYTPSDEFVKSLTNDFTEEITGILDADFSELAVKCFQTDPRFLMGGERYAVLELKRKDEHSPEKDVFYFEYPTPAGSHGQTWEGGRADAKLIMALDLPAHQF